MVFGGPYRPDEGSGLHGEQLASLVDVLSATYATTIVDVGVDARNALPVRSRARRPHRRADRT